MNKKTENALKQILKMNGWSKSGGHPNKKLKLIQDTLKIAGFRAKKASHKSTPDGSNDYTTQNFTHPIGLEAQLWSKYGSTKWDNSFNFGVRVKGSQ